MNSHFRIGLSSLFLFYIFLFLHPQGVPTSLLNRLFHLSILCFFYQYVHRSTLFHLVLLIYAPLFSFFLLILLRIPVVNYTLTYTFSVLVLCASIFSNSYGMICPKSKISLFLHSSLILVCTISLPLASEFNSRLMAFTLSVVLIVNVIRTFKPLFASIVLRLNRLISIFAVFFLSLVVLYGAWYVALSLPVFANKGLITSRDLTAFYFWSNWQSYLPFGNTDLALETIDGTLHYHNLFFDSWRAAGFASLPLLVFTLLTLFILFRLSGAETLCFFILIWYSIPLDASFADLIMTVLFIIIGMEMSHRRRSLDGSELP